MWNQEEWQGSQNNASQRPPCNPPDCFKDFWDTDKFVAMHKEGRCENRGEVEREREREWTEMETCWCGGVSGYEKVTYDKIESVDCATTNTSKRWG